MHRRLVVLVASCLLITGCAPVADRDLVSTTTPTSSASAMPLGASKSVESSHLSVSLDGITYTNNGFDENASFEDGDAMVAVFNGVTGAASTGEPLEDYGDYQFNLTSYDWDGVRILIDEAGRAISVSVSNAVIEGVPISTVGGLAVGSARSEAMMAGAWAIWDSDGDGVADYLGIGSRSVAGTQSLATPGFVGSEYVLLIMAGDTVVQFQAPSNDYSDL